MLCPVPRGPQPRDAAAAGGSRSPRATDPKREPSKTVFLLLSLLFDTRLRRRVPTFRFLAATLIPQIYRRGGEARPRETIVRRLV